MDRREIATKVAWHYLGTPYVWGGDDFSAFDCCLPDFELVHTPDGPRPIPDITVGDQVWGTDSHGASKLQTVTAVHENGIKPTLVVCTSSRKLYVTGNHPILAYKPFKSRRGAAWTVRQNAKLEWYTADTLAQDDWIVVSRQQGDDSPITADRARIAGVVIGDGYIARSGRQMTLALFDDTQRELYTQLIRSEWPSVGKITPHETHGLCISHKKMVSDLLDLGCGGKSVDARVPAWVMSSSRPIQEAFLAGYADADGYIHTRTRGKSSYDCTHFAAASEELIRGLHLLLTLRGEQISSITVQYRTKPIIIRGRRVRNARPLHRFDWYPNGRRQKRSHLKIKDFDDLVGLADDANVERVIRVEPGPELRTWNLSTAPDNTFIAGGVVTHNSGYVLEILQSVGLVPHNQDTTAHGLYAMFVSRKVDLPTRGCLVFWERSGKMVHVEFCLDTDLSIGSSGGGSATEDEADAILQNAYVKVRPFAPRKGHAKLYYVDPFGDPTITVDV